MKQMKLNIYKGKRGGRRPGSGRKRIHSPGVAHRSREKIRHWLPLHVNMKYRLVIKRKEFLRTLKRAILNCRKKGLRIIHYSVQSNHVHFIIEAPSNDVLSRGMRSLAVTLARGIDQGKVQIGRYHLHVLRSLQERRNAVRYVVFNEERHSGRRIVDAYSSVSLYLNLHIRQLVTSLDPPRTFAVNSRSR